MTTIEQIKILCVRRGVSMSELARLLGKSPQAFSQQMKRGTFTPAELKEIAKAVKCKYHGWFELPNGEKIED